MQESWNQWPITHSGSKGAYAEGGDLLLNKRSDYGLLKELCMPVGFLFLIISNQMRVYYILFWWRWELLFSSLWLSPDLVLRTVAIFIEFLLNVCLRVSFQKRFIFHWYCETFLKKWLHPINLKNRGKLCFPSRICYNWHQTVFFDYTGFSLLI